MCALQERESIGGIHRVTPRLRRSGSPVRGRSTISRSGHAAIRHSLHMPALVAFKHNPIIKTFGARLKAGGLAPKGGGRRQHAQARPSDLWHPEVRHSVQPSLPGGTP